MHQYTKFFLVTIITVFIATNGVEAASIAGGALDPAKSGTAGGSGASVRPVAALPGFEELAVKAYFADPAKKPAVLVGLVYNSVTPERDPRAVLADLGKADPLGFLNLEAYPSDNLRALHGQLYRIAPYLDALMAAHLELLKPKPIRTGIGGKPVPPLAGEVPSDDHGALGRTMAARIRAEMQTEIDRLTAQLVAADKGNKEKVAAEVARTKAAEAAAGKLREAHARELEALRTTLTGEIGEMRARLAGFADAEALLRTKIASLEEGIVSARAAADAVVAKAAEDIAMVAKDKAENEAIRTRGAAATARVDGLVAELAASQRQVAAFKAQLDESNKARASLTASNSELYTRLGEGATLVDRLKAQITGLGAIPVR